ncbi:MAG: hypothetical protein NC217_08565 [Muribaculaceae bacterium]|nr:hypothetical protein [Muribaculaceae bacterium]
MVNLRKYKSLVLPVALVAGYFCRTLCASLAFTVPYVIFAILILSLSGVKLSRLRPGKLDLYIATFQAVVSALLYWVALKCFSNTIIAQGAMMCVLCPVASSVTVVAVMLGADKTRTVTYTIVGNLLVALLAPIYITIIADGGMVSFWYSFFKIFIKIASVIALPCFVIALLQKFVPKANDKIAECQSSSFYLWAYALFVTIGQTADFVVARWGQDHGDIGWLIGISGVVCMVQFAVGKLIGRHCGDTIAGGQMLAQKNSAIGIWMLNTFLNPIASVAMAGYSIFQNIFNSWQIYAKMRRK